MPLDLKRYDIPGHVHFWTISCYRRLSFFWDDGMKQVVVDSLRRLREKHTICLIGYVIMPDHVHVLLYPHALGCDEPTPVSQLLREFKQYVGFYGKALLRDYWRKHGRLWSEPLTHWAVNGPPKRSIWNTRGYDFNIDRKATLLEKLDYVHRNPVTRGLVDTPEQWPWSSYRFHELADDSVLPMDWDGQWPILW